MESVKIINGKKPILELKDVSVSYTPGKNAVDKVSTEIYPNTITAIMGPSGCGKSTLLRAVNRMLEEEAGAPLFERARTRGRLTYREGKRGALEVSADVTFVYPVVRAEGARDEVVRTVVRRETVMSWDDPGKVVTEPGTFSLLSYRLHVTNGGCGYFPPPFGEDRPEATTGDEIDPYDRSRELRDGSGDQCDKATRS